MAQLTYNKFLTAGFAGQLYDNGDRYVAGYSNSSATAIPLGAGVVQGPDDFTCRLPAANVALMTYSADFVSSNSITFVVNGVAITPVTFTSNQATTLAALVTAIDGLSIATGVTLTAVSGTDKITVTASDPSITLTISSVVTGGASQATGTASYTTSDTFLGIAIQEHTVVQDYTTGAVNYAQFSTVPVAQIARVYVANEATVTNASPVYLRYLTNGGNTPGGWRADADTARAVQITQAKWVTSVTGAGIAVLNLVYP